MTVLILIIIIISFIVLIKKNSHNDGGSFGETQVATKSRSCFTSPYRVLYNVYLSWPSGSTTEIDEIVITTSGIYVIEVKNYKGWIFGNQWDNYWTQVLPYGYQGKSIKNKFYNPIKQNEGHINCIKKNLDLPYKVAYHSIIVFSDNCVFKNLTYYHQEVKVIHKHGMKKCIEAINASFENNIGLDEIDLIYNKLSELSIKDENIKERHVNEIRRKYYST